MKKTIIVTLCFSLAVFSSIAQKALVEELNRINSPAVALAPIRFLASDELMGRATLRPEINVAARYISEQFRSFGVKEVPGTLDYFQSFDIKTLVPALGGSITINQTTYELGKNFIVFRGSENITITAPVVFAGYGTEADFNKVDVKGKIVVTRLGKNDSTSSSGIRFINAKRKLASEKGALTLIELYTPGNTNWDQLTVRYMAERIRQEEAITLPVFIINDEKNVLSSSIQNGVNGTIHVIINSGKTVVAKNVMGWVEGTDPQLKKEFIVVSSHYDHLGISRQPKMEEGKLDSIYNGARDNAIGTAAVIGAARYFSQHPARRSILFIAYTGEEIGLVGSKYFAEHPALPLHQLVYNLNNDNANYNDTTIVTVVALERTSAAADIKKSCAAYGLTATSDSELHVNLFEGSDNFSLAAKGVPAPTFSLGMRKFDQTISSRYHQLSDEVTNLNLRYALKFINAFVLSAKNIADNPVQPTWIKGDKYENDWKRLYHK